MVASKKAVDELSIVQAEEEAASQARKMVQGLEKALSAWDKAGHAPEDLAARFNSYRALLDKLRKWEAAAPKKPGSYLERLKRLRELAEIGSIKV